MSPAELARIQRITKLRAAQQRLAAAAHARDRAAFDAACRAEAVAWTEVDDAAEAAVASGADQRVDDLVDARLRVSMLSHLAARRASDARSAERAAEASSAQLRASTLTREQMETWLGGATEAVRAADSRREDHRLDELAARSRRTKENA